MMCDRNVVLNAFYGLFGGRDNLPANPAEIKRAVAETAGQFVNPHASASKVPDGLARRIPWTLTNDGMDQLVLSAIDVCSLASMPEILA